MSLFWGFQALYVSWRPSHRSVRSELDLLARWTGVPNGMAHFSSRIYWGLWLSDDCHVLQPPLAHKELQIACVEGQTGAPLVSLRKKLNAER